MNETVNWEMFRPALEKARDKGPKSTIGPKGYDAILQSLYNLSDEATEFQILDRHSFGCFLGLHISREVPDTTTIWRFREDLVKADIVQELFATYDAHLRDNGFMAIKGQIVDAGIVSVPKQRNSREANAKIKAGEIPADWPERKRCRKDVDARWTKKNGKSLYGYRNHISVDVKHKMIRGYTVTNAAVHDSKVFDQLLSTNTSKDVWADRLERLTKDGFREHIQRKGSRCHPLTPREQEGNRTRSGIRSRIEHIFDVQAQRAGNLLLRTIGIGRAWAKIGLRNLAYNIDRIGMLPATRG